jgi:hypothetical protein
VPQPGGAGDIQPKSDPAEEGEALATDPLTQERLVEIWSKAVDTQMHFNEMSAKSRQLGLAFVAAALGVGIVLLGQGRAFTLVVYGFKIHVTVFLILSAILAILAVRKLDLGVYHRMLRGAVTFGEDVEAKHLNQLLGLNMGMAQVIAHYSRHSDADSSGVPKAYTGSAEKTAGDKVNSFYMITIWSLVASAAALLAVTNLADEPLEIRNNQPIMNQQSVVPEPADSVRANAQQSVPPNELSNRSRPQQNKQGHR